MNKKEILENLDGLAEDIDNGTTKVASYGRRLGDKFYESLSVMDDVDPLTAANVLLYLADELTLGAMLTDEVGLTIAATACFSAVSSLLEDVDD